MLEAWNCSDSRIFGVKVFARNRYQLGSLPVSYSVVYTIGMHITRPTYCINMSHLLYGVRILMTGTQPTETKPLNPTQLRGHQNQK